MSIVMLNTAQVSLPSIFNLDFWSNDLKLDKFVTKYHETSQKNISGSKGLNTPPSYFERIFLICGNGSLPEDEDEGEERQQWSHPIEFLLSCIAMSVGLGNVWRFPTTAYENGGGAFLIPYLVVLTFIGRPLYFMELAMGQFSSFGSVKVWKMVPAVKGVGFGQCIATWSVVTYYCSLMALTVFYFVHSFQAVLPWTVCDPAWADDNCRDASYNYTALNTTGEVLFLNDTSPMAKGQSSSEQFFYKYVLNYKADISDGIGLPEWRLTLCLLFSWVVLFLTLAKGVQSSGKVAYFTAIFPYLVLFTLLGRGVTLPGSVDGILYFITPQWHRLLEIKVWYAAVTQSFFSLSVGFGSITMFSSYNSFNQNIYRDAWIISLADTLTSMLAGFTVFSILGNLAYELDDSIENVVRSGAGLAFISYPDAIAKFNWVPQLFAVLFFLMLFTLGLGSAAGLTGGVIAVICDQFPTWKKSYVTAGVAVAGFLIGLVYVTPGGQWILELVDYFGGGFIIFVLVIVEVIAVNWIYGMKNFISDIKFMLHVDLGIYWKFCWLIFIPVALTGILVYILIDIQLPKVDGMPFPDIAYTCGWILSGVAIGMVVIFFIHAVSKSQGDSLFEKIGNTFKPKDTWGPKKASNRREWEKAKNT
ncbi:unnamed protein product, partial [Meganyctiphanes norvegica]